MEGLRTITSVIAHNLLGFDLLIFLVAAINAFCYTRARRLALQLHKTLHITIFLPEQVLLDAEAKPAYTAMPEAELVDLREHANSVYAVFANLTGIFPLLGILGTVISLIPMVVDLANMQQNFFAALTSTFWGLVFAILFKFLDGFLSPRMDENNNNIDLYFTRKKLPGELPCETETEA